MSVENISMKTKTVKHTKAGKQSMKVHVRSIIKDHPSGAMAIVGAVKIFRRSITNRRLKYKTFVGDGDSDTFKVVCEEFDKMYGNRYQRVKEECIGHIQKCMGNDLRVI